MAANFTVLTNLIEEMFDLIDVLIQGVVDLITGNLLVLVVVGAIITLITGIIFLILKFVKDSVGGSVKMKK